MDEEEDLRIPLIVVFSVIALVISLVIGLSIWKLNRARADVPVVEAQITPVAGIVATVEVPMAVADGVTGISDERAFSDVMPVGEAKLKVYFEVGQTDLPEPARADIAALAAVISQMSAGEAVVLISGFHDESGSAQVNADIARQRANTVRNALIAEGVAAEVVQLRKPEMTLGGGEAAEARRVEIHVQ